MEFISELCNLQKRKVVLASQSPRRIELLRSVGLKFEIFPAKIEEKIRPGMLPVEYARHNASEKAQWVSKRVTADLVISADTVVTVGNQIFEKPVDRQHASEMLKQLSGGLHQVITGICLLWDERVVIDHEITDVQFYPLTDSELEMYLLSDEPFDKAGAYGIQGFASLFIKKIEGCYFNVVGFPLARFYQDLKKICS